MIDFFNTEKKYGEKIALKSFSYAFKANASYALIGRNGSGKSTLLKLIAKEISPSFGEINSVGKISFMAQSSYPFDMTMQAFVSLILGREQAQSFISLCEFETLKKTKIKALSGGEKQKLYLALALFIEHDVLLLDEPTSNLDQEILKEAEKNILKDKCPLKIIATHSILQAQRLADKILFLDGGELVEVLDKSDGFLPKCARTKEFFSL